MKIVCQHQLMFKMIITMMYLQCVSVCSHSEANLHNRSQVGFKLNCAKVINMDATVPHRISTAV